VAAVPSRNGGLVWDFVTAFFASRRAFLAVFRRYESRVLAFAREAGVHRDDLVLPPGDLARLFHPKRLQHLRDQRLVPLRALAHQLFREAGVVEPLDTVCSHVFHEVSILLEEHLSVVRFRHVSDPKRYEQMFEEVRGYYPLRLRRIRRLFADGLRRLEELLPGWAADRVVVRSAYLFGGRIARGVWEDDDGRPLDALYARMYPAGAAAEGYLAAGKSFLASGFAPETVAALEASVRAGKRARSASRRRTPAGACATEAKRLLASLARPAA
jgi:hypothetical protein